MIPQLVWNDSGGSLRIFAISGYCRFLTTFHRSAQFAALDDENWALMAPSCSLESRGAAKTLTKIMFRGCSNVLSPSKAISPSVRTIITAVFILFLFVLMGLSNVIFVSVLHKGFRMLTTPCKNVPFTFLRNERSCQKNMSTCGGSLSVQTEMPFFLPESRFSGWTFLHLQMEGRDTEKTEHTSGNSCPTSTSVLIPQECTRETNMSLWQAEMNPGHTGDITGYCFIFLCSYFSANNLLCIPTFIFFSLLYTSCISNDLCHHIVCVVSDLGEANVHTNFKRK